jgi:hypothetical protein
MSLFKKFNCMAYFFSRLLNNQKMLLDMSGLIVQYGIQKMAFTAMCHECVKFSKIKKYFNMLSDNIDNTWCDNMIC